MNTIESQKSLPLLQNNTLDLVDNLEVDISDDTLIVKKTKVATIQKQLLKELEVADLIGGVSVGTIINWSKKGTLIEYGIGRLIRYKKSEVLNSLIKLNA
jgi:hypothetical protein